MDGALVGAGTLWPHNLTSVFYRLYNLLFGRKTRFIFYFFIPFPVEKCSSIDLFMLSEHELGLTSFIYLKSKKGPIWI
jgi:hypothetical protein